jgi:hypothetical protein
MGRSIEFSGQGFVTVAYGLQWALVLAGVLVLGLGLDEPRELAVAVTASLLAGIAFSAWNVRRADDSEVVSGRPGDVTWGPLEPGQAAKNRWRAAVQRLPGSDDSDENEN